MGDIFGFLKPNRKPPKEKVSDNQEALLLLSHPIFHDLTRYQSIFIDTLTIEDPIKKKMASCYLRIIFDTVADILNDTVANYRKYSNDITCLTSSMYKKYSQIEGNARAHGIPDIFLNKITPRVIENLITLTSVVDDTHLQHKYNNDVGEILSFMDMYLLQLRYTYNAIGGIINNMNGELHRVLEGSIFDEHQ